MSDQRKTENLEKMIMQVTAQKKPETVNQLAELVKETSLSSNKEILDAIVKMHNEGKLQLTEPPQQTPGIQAYLKTSAALWFWTTIVLSLVTLVAVFTISETAFPLVYIRYVLGSVFILWLPGYAFIRALFPEQLPVKTSDKDLDTIERMALSVGMSLALVPMVGLLLNYTPWGIRLTPIVLSLLALTAIFATIGVIRERQIRIHKARAHQ